MGNRREFVRSLMAAGAGLAVVPLSACGDDSGGGADSGTGRDSGGGRDSGSGGNDSGTNDSGTKDSGTEKDSGSGDGGADSGVACEPKGVIGEASRHSHGGVLNVSKADVAAGVEKVYTIEGGHTHKVTLTAAHFSELAKGGPVVVDSSRTNAHVHAIDVTCAFVPD